MMVSRERNSGMLLPSIVLQGLLLIFIYYYIPVSLGYPWRTLFSSLRRDSEYDRSLLSQYCYKKQEKGLLVCLELRPVSVEEKILVPEKCRLLWLQLFQHSTLAPASPRWEVGMARSNQSAGQSMPSEITERLIIFRPPRRRWLRVSQMI